jgi:hypothetical protein
MFQTLLVHHQGVLYKTINKQCFDLLYVEEVVGLFCVGYVWKTEIVTQ